MIATLPKVTTPGHPELLEVLQLAARPEGFRPVDLGERVLGDILVERGAAEWRSSRTADGAFDLHATPAGFAAALLQQIEEAATLADLADNNAHVRADAHFQRLRAVLNRRPA
jgi:hypothetical protein